MLLVPAHVPTSWQLLLAPELELGLAPELQLGLAPELGRRRAPELQLGGGASSMAPELQLAPEMQRWLAPLHTLSPQPSPSAPPQLRIAGMLPPYPTLQLPPPLQPTPSPELEQLRQ